MLNAFGLMAPGLTANQVRFLVLHFSSLFQLKNCYRRLNRSLNSEDGNGSYYSTSNGCQESQNAESYTQRRSKNRNSSRSSKFRQYSQRKDVKLEPRIRRQNSQTPNLKPIRLFSDSSDGEISTKEPNFDSEREERENLTYETVQNLNSQNDYVLDAKNKSENGG